MQRCSHARGRNLLSAGAPDCSFASHARLLLLLSEQCGLPDGFHDLDRGHNNSNSGVYIANLAVLLETHSSWVVIV